ncbi:hypothetical protein [Streptomyces hawaiiensis]|nr:hypothetical protein [Streptomyces hawaiiensis]
MTWPPPRAARERAEDAAYGLGHGLPVAGEDREQQLARLGRNGATA